MLNGDQILVFHVARSFDKIYSLALNGIALSLLLLEKKGHSYLEKLSSHLSWLICSIDKIDPIMRLNLTASFAGITPWEPRPQRPARGGQGYDTWTLRTQTFNPWQSEEKYSRQGTVHAKSLRQEGAGLPWGGRKVCTAEHRGETAGKRAGAGQGLGHPGLEGPGQSNGFYSEGRGEPWRVL